MTEIVDPNGEPADAWMKLALARSTPDQQDRLVALSTRPMPDRRLIAATCHGMRLLRLLCARYQGGIPRCTEQARSIYQPVRLGLLDHLAHADAWAEHGLAWRLLPEMLADLADLDTLLRQQEQEGSRAWIDDFWALGVQLRAQCQARGVEPFLDLLNGYFWEFDKATEAIHRETCESNVQAGLVAECAPLPSVGLTMETYLEQEQRKLDAEKDWCAYWRDLPADLQALLLSLDPARMAQFGKLEHEQVRIICALARLVRLRWLITAKFGHGPRREPHPRETVTYQDLRRDLLDDLRAAGLEAQWTWASDGIAERLSDLGAGERAWDSAGIERFEEDLIRASATKRVDELVAALDPFFAQQGIDSIIREIDKETRAANAQRTDSDTPDTGHPDLAPPPEDEPTERGETADRAEPGPDGLSTPGIAADSESESDPTEAPGTTDRKLRGGRTPKPPEYYEEKIEDIKKWLADYYWSNDETPPQDVFFDKCKIISDTTWWRWVKDGHLTQTYAEICDEVKAKAKRRGSRTVSLGAR